MKSVTWSLSFFYFKIRTASVVFYTNKKQGPTGQLAMSDLTTKCAVIRHYILHLQPINISWIAHNGESCFVTIYTFLNEYKTKSKEEVLEEQWRDI